MSSDTVSPGIGHGVYRDPWGNPYIITMDLSYDDQCSDFLYSHQVVSQISGQTGLNGLFNPTPAAIRTISFITARSWFGPPGRMEKLQFGRIKPIPASTRTT